jgi:AcrR family transcriptional regulator
MDRSDPGRRRDRPALRREALLVAALRLFAERGVGATTIGDIAAATGSAHGLIYHYYRSKDELLAAVLERFSYLPELRRLLAASPDRPAAAVLTEIAEGISRLIEERPELLRLVIAESGTNPVVAEALSRVTAEGLDALTGYLQARIDAGELRAHDASVPARALFWSVITHHLVPDRTTGFERDLVTVLLDGIATR